MRKTLSSHINFNYRLSTESERDTKCRKSSFSRRVGGKTFWRKQGELSKLTLMTILS